MTIKTFLVAGIGIFAAFYFARTYFTDKNSIAKQSDFASREKESPKYPVVTGFDYPVGEKGKVTAKKDGDGWFNAQDFGRNLHLGEDWNAETGGNSDCGSPVYAAAEGIVIYSADVANDWGQMMVIRHHLPDGSEVETLYAHLSERYKAVGDKVKRREHIAAIGDGQNPCGDIHLYYAHLHFELRTPKCRGWGKIVEGYSDDPTGWVDPSDYIDKHREF